MAASPAPRRPGPRAEPGRSASDDVRDDPQAPRPLGLVLAAAVVGLQGLALLAYVVFLVVETVVATPEHRDVATGSATFLGLFALALCGVGWALWRRHGWASGAAVTVQLLAVAIAWYMLAAHFWVGGVPLVAGIVLSLGGLFAPSTRRALGR